MKTIRTLLIAFIFGLGCCVAQAQTAPEQKDNSKKSTAPKKDKTPRDTAYKKNNTTPPVSKPPKNNRVPHDSAGKARPIKG